MRRLWYVMAMAVLVLLPAGRGQDSSPGLSPRELFYREQPDNDKLPPVRAAKPAATPKKTTQQVAKTTPAATPAQDSAPASGGDQTGHVPVVTVAAVQHLGLRYNLLLVDPDTGKTTPANPESIFRQGDCLQIEFFPNRSGYLYVIYQSSSKVWEPLLPSADMPDEANIVRSRTTTRVPQRSCFGLEAPAGEERLFIVLSRNPEDIYGLNDAIKSRASEPAPAAQPAREAVLSADNRLDDAIKKVAALQNRDIKIKKIVQSDDGDPPQSVYVTNASDNPSDKLIFEVRIRHH